MYKLIWRKGRLERDADVGQGARGKFKNEDSQQFEEREKCDKWRAAV